MNRKRSKALTEMNAAELAEATAEFDREFVKDQFKPLSAEQRARWQKVRSKSTKDRNGLQVIAVRLDKELLEHCNALAKKKRISRDSLIARGLKAVLAAEGVA